MRVNEESSATFTVRPMDENGSPFIPTTMRYRVDDLASSTQIIGWTAATPSVEVTIVVPASAHTMIDPDKPEEVRVLTVQSDYDTDDQHSEEKRYDLVNLAFAEVP